MELLDFLAKTPWPTNADFCVQNADGTLIACQGELAQAKYSKGNWTVNGVALGVFPLAYDNDTAKVPYAQWRTARDKHLNKPLLRLKEVLRKAISVWPENAAYAVQDKTGVIWFVPPTKTNSVECKSNGVWKLPPEAQAHYEVLPVADDFGMARVSRKEWTADSSPALALVPSRETQYSPLKMAA